MNIPNSASDHAPASISIQDWMEAMRDLPPSLFAERAVDLAWRLTNNLCRIIDDSALGAHLSLEDHVRADDVIIYTLPPPDVSRSRYDSDIAVIDAKFRSLILIEPAPVEGSAEPAARAHAPSNIPLPPPARAALGKLFFGIFSRFASSGAGTGAAGDRSPSGRAAHEGHDDPLKPARKRRATSTLSAGASDTIGESERARGILISSGMPLSVCQLVDDLLGANGGEPVNALSPLSLEDMLAADARPRMLAIKSIREALQDLSQMKAHPAKFLFDRTCPQKALDDTCLFTSNVQLVGREKEMRALAASKSNISGHVREMENNYANHSALSRDGNFLCEAIFLSGYAGCGKSCLVHSLTHSCSDDKWFVLGCKFSQQSSPHMVLSEAFNGFFGKWGAANSNPNSDLPSEMIQSFNRICTNIFNLMDDEALRHLCYFVPNFARVFPLIDLRSNPHHDNNEVSMDQVGSGRKRTRNLLHVLLKSICSAGYPVLFTLDDLQWSDPHVLGDLSDFILSDIHDTARALDARQKGLLVVGTFRRNEVDGEFLDKIIAMEEASKANVSTITIGDFSKEDVNKLVSSKLCLPDRYTWELAHLVHAKTRGNVFFVLQFMQSIIRNKMLTYSLRYRRWIWDCDVVDMQMISDDVAQLLTTTLDQLPSTLQKTLKIISCLGIQVEEATIKALDSKSDVLPFNMLEQLSLAVGEGIMEKAGPVYQFTHDIVHQTIYELIPLQNRKILHKTIGMSLLNESSFHTLATDQIHIFCKSATPSDEERLLFAQNTVEVAKNAIATSSFDQACAYIDMGIQLLDVQHWQTQYSLSLDLFEMSASVNWAQGKLSEMAFPLAAILSNAKDFDDTLTASSLAVKLLMASSKFDQAEQKCLRVLKKLGEEDFPSEYDGPFILSELGSMNESLRTITAESVKQLPAMKNKHKLSAMKFLNLLCMCGYHSKPMLRPLASCRMVKLTMQHGFCDDSIVGLLTIGNSIFQCSEDFRLAAHISKVVDSLVEQSSKKHMLRSRLCTELYKTLIEPLASVVRSLPDYYRSAMMVGDVESALNCRWVYDAGMFWSASFDLVTIIKNLTATIKEAFKYNLQPVAHHSMSMLNLALELSKAKSDIKVLSFDELYDIGEQTMWQAFICRIGFYFWIEDYVKLVELSALYQQNSQRSPKNRTLNIWRKLYEGIAYFHLARDTGKAKWTMLGGRATEWMARIEPMCSWNYTNKVQLLQAESHYTGGNLALAEASYKASIESANAHRLIHEEALALELYGVFCFENHMFAKGLEHLQTAVERYEKWGALMKVDQLREKIDLMNDATACWAANDATMARTVEGVTLEHPGCKTPTG